MRRFLRAIALISFLGSSVAGAADVEFELGPKLFEKPAENDDASRQFTKSVTDDDAFRRCFVINPIPNFFTYDSPLFEGLWPMTIDALRRVDFSTRKEVFGFSIASNF